MKILFAASEAYPIIKTGGLGDVVYSLPRALEHEGVEVRVILPAYRAVLEQMDQIRVAGWLELPGVGQTHNIRILETTSQHLGVPLLLVDVASLFDRPGNPYVHPDGYNWHDNAERFTVFSRAVAQLSVNKEILDWQPDVVHCHDWQTGLIPACLSQLDYAPKSVFTIHNLSYAGIFSHEDFARLNLNKEWWSSHAMEFFGNFSMLKAGLIFADQVTTVSPNYAEEIRTPGQGYGFDGILRSISGKLSGILNGIDEDVWNPQSDSYLLHRYSVDKNYLAGKRKNKEALLNELGASDAESMLDKPLLGLIGRLVEQKGIDLLLPIIPHFIEHSQASFVIIGSGEPHYEDALQELAERYPERLFVTIGYSEERAHRIEAGADMFLMPSRFEPCGLNQLYSLKYGTLPIVHNVGGLADTVVDANEENLEDETATGFAFHQPTPMALQQTIDRALTLYPQTSRWRKVMRTAMRKNFSWDLSAKKYELLYQKLIG